MDIVQEYFIASQVVKVMQFVLIGVYLILTVAGLVFMKLGGNPGTLAVKDGTITLGMSVVSGIGFVCYLCSFLLFTRVVVMFDLSYIVPITTGIAQILTLVASYCADIDFNCISCCV